MSAGVQRQMTKDRLSVNLNNTQGHPFQTTNKNTKDKEKTPFHFALG